MSGLTRSDLRRLLGVSEEFLDALEREAIVAPDPEGDYPGHTVERVRICWNLHHELDVNLAGQEVILGLLERLGRERRQFVEVLTWLQGALRDQPPR